MDRYARPSICEEQAYYSGPRTYLEFVVRQRRLTHEGAYKSCHTAQRMFANESFLTLADDCEEIVHPP